MELFKSNLWEIKNSSSLRYLGFALALAHLLTYWLWSGHGFFQGQEPICWSFFKNCANNFLITPGNTPILIKVYAGLALLSLFTFATFRLVGFGIFCLFLATILNFVFYIFDINLSANDNLLLLFLSFFFVFIPQKVRVAKATILSSYFIWGLLKVNPEWLAGYWLNQHLAEVLPIKGIEWIAAITLFAEMVVPFFLLSRQLQRFASGVLLLLVFHVSKGYIVGEAKSLIQILYLGFFVFTFFEDERKEREKIYRSFIRPEPSRMWVFVVMFLFWPLQVLPHTLFKNHRAHWPLIFTEYPIPEECQHHTFAYYEKGVKHLSDKIVDVPSRVLRCKAPVYFQSVKDKCQEMSRDQSFKRYASYFLHRSISDADFNRIFEVDDVCNTEYPNTFKVEGP